MDEIRNYRFIRQNFTREKWVSRFINCEFIFCTFDNSDFSESVFIAVSGYGNKIEHSNQFPEGYRLGKDGILYGPESIDLRDAVLADCYVDAKDWSNAKLSKITIYRAGFTDCDFTGADFSESDLEDVTFDNCNFSRANFGTSKFTRINFRGCTIEKSKFGDTEFMDVRFNWTHGAAESLPPQFKLLDGVMFGPGANIARTTIGAVDLREINLNGIISGGVIGNPILASGWKLANGYLVGPGANLSDANLSDTYLENIDLEGTDLSNATLIGVRSSNLYGTPTSLPDGYQIVGGLLIGPKVVMTNCDISSLDLSGAQLYGIASENLSANDTLLPRGWCISNGYLIGNSANVGKADLSHQTIHNVDISGMDFSECSLTGISGFSLAGEPKKLPIGWRLSGGVLLGPSANVSGLDLSMSDLSGLPLAGPFRVIGKPAKLPPDWLFISGYLVGPGADLRNADFSGSDFKNSNLNGADLSSAILDGVSSGEIVGIPAALPTDWSLIAGYLLGPGADLRNATLSGSDLRHSNLNGSNLIGADLSECTIGPAVGSPSHLPNGFFHLENGFIGPNLILSGIRITAKDLSTLGLS